MSDDAISKAVVLNKKLAASLLVKKEELEERVRAGGASDAVVAELASIDAQFADVRKELIELRKLAEQRGSPVPVLADDDPLTPSLETAALNRARDGINELEAEASLTQQPPVVQTSKPDPEELARQEFDKLREGKPPVKRTM